MGDVTVLLSRWSNGDPDALEALVSAVHRELRQLARGLLRHERAEHTLQPTELVHEAYLRLEGLREVAFGNQKHFYGAAAEAMRRILVDHARSRRALKRGGPMREQLPLDAVLNLPIDIRLDFERLSDALDDLAKAFPEQAKVVELRYFAGLSIEDTAGALGVSPATIKRHWVFARAWLADAMAR